MFMFSRILGGGMEGAQRERQRKGTVVGAKGEGVPGRALTVAPGSALMGKRTDCTRGEQTYHRLRCQAHGFFGMSIGTSSCCAEDLYSSNLFFLFLFLNSR